MKDLRTWSLLMPIHFPTKTSNGKRKRITTPPNPSIEKKVLAPDDSEDKGEASTEQEQDHHGKKDGHDQRQMGIDVGKVDVGHEPKGHGPYHQNQTGQEKEQNEKLFLRPVVYILFLQFLDRFGQVCIHPTMRYFPSTVPSGMGNPLRNSSAESLLFPGYWSSPIPILP